MGRTCAVPGCKTGYRSTKEKWSLFTVPKNIERHKKWQAAIPAIQLKPSYFVCEKHFEEKYILKESITRDSQGRIIAQVSLYISYVYMFHMFIYVQKVFI